MRQWDDENLNFNMITFWMSVSYEGGYWNLVWVTKIRLRGPTWIFVGILTTVWTYFLIFLCPYNFHSFFWLFECLYLILGYDAEIILWKIVFLSIIRKTFFFFIFSFQAILLWNHVLFPHKIPENLPPPQIFFLVEILLCYLGSVYRPRRTKEIFFYKS